jgi:uncharacterized protein (TIGR00255 family)
VVTEIRSYNSRHLDVALRLPNNYLKLENRIKALISEKVGRGRVEVKLQIRDDADAALAFEIHTPKAKAFQEALDQLKDGFRIKPAMTFNSLVDAGVVIAREPKRDTEECWNIIRECIDKALDSLIEMRAKEGNFIARDIHRRLDSIEACIHKIDQGSEGMLSHYQERLRERITRLTKGMVELDPARVSQEAAFLADKSDISEEIVRASSHIRQFRSIMESAGPAGQKLNFLVQEFHREFNTMGSKTEKAQISHIVVDAKSELEKIREQVQNIE